MTAILSRQSFASMAQGFLLASVNASDVPRPSGRKRGGRSKPSKRAVLMAAAVAAAEMARSAPDEDGGQFS